MSGTGTVTKWSTGVSGPQHLQSLVQKGDTIIQSVKLEGTHLERNRYLAVVQNSGLDNYCLLGLDEVQQDPGGLSVGLVAKLLWDAQISLDGDGGFSVRQLGRHLIFKPVSVQALWTVIQTLHMISERLSPSPPKSLESPSLDEDVTAALPWPECAYLVQSPQSCINEWHFMADLLVRRPPSPDRAAGPDGTQDSETIIKTKLRQIMKTVDLDSITSKSIRKQLEGEMEKDLEEFKSFIDKEILLILGKL